MRDFFKNQYVLHSLGAIAVIVVLVAGFLFWLKGYTRHDQTTPTPDLQGMDATLAVQPSKRWDFAGRSSTPRATNRTNVRVPCSRKILRPVRP